MALKLALLWQNGRCRLGSGSIERSRHVCNSAGRIYGAFCRGHCFEFVEVGAPFCRADQDLMDWRDWCRNRVRPSLMCDKGEAHG